MGTQNIYSLIKNEFYLKCMGGDDKKLIKECNVCQVNKYENLNPLRLLQSLPIPSKAQVNINLDFIKRLPLSKGYSVIMVIIDRFSKRNHFLPLAPLYTDARVARIFMDNIFNLHRLPQSIVSDRDAIVTSNFWKKMFNLFGITLLLISPYHP